MCLACVHEHGWAGCDHGGGGTRALPPSVCASTRVHMAPGEEMFKNGAVSPELTGVVSKAQRRQEGPLLLHSPGGNGLLCAEEAECGWNKASGADPKTSLIKETH